MLNNKHISKLFANGMLFVMLIVTLFSLSFKDINSKIIKDKAIFDKLEGALSGDPYDGEL